MAPRATLRLCGLFSPEAERPEAVTVSCLPNAWDCALDRRLAAGSSAQMRGPAPSAESIP